MTRCPNPGRRDNAEPLARPTRPDLIEVGTMKRIAILGAVCLLIASASVTLAAGTGGQWNATLASGGISGTSTLTLAGNGRSATDIVWFKGLLTGTQVTGEVRAGACGTPGTHITTLLPFTTTSGGTWRDRWIFVGRDLGALKAALAKGTSITIRTTVGSRSACAPYSVTP